MVSKLTLLRLLLLSTMALNTIYVTAQNKLHFTYNQESFTFNTFNSVKGSISKAETLVRASENQTPSLEQKSEEVKRETGIRVVISTFRDPIIFPIPEQRFVKYETTAKENYRRQMQQAKSAEASFATPQQKTDGKVDKIELLRKAKEAELKELQDRIKKGEKDAVKDLERLSEELIQIIEGNLEGISLTEIEDALAYFNISIFIPYEDGKYEKEVVLNTGELEVLALNETTIIARFKGEAITYCDKWDEETKKSISKELGRLVVGKAEMNRGMIEGKVEMSFTSFVDER